jgi:hypothetical protein
MCEPLGKASVKFVAEQDMNPFPSNYERAMSMASPHDSFITPLGENRIPWLPSCHSATGRTVCPSSDLWRCATGTAQSDNRLQAIVTQLVL